ncbi:MAG: HDOD domain-containing protein [Actinomycetota bacterium]|nr:HDOD domain-containing protein [Actinomycetota bacterium]
MATDKNKELFEKLREKKLAKEAKGSAKEESSKAAHKKGDKDEAVKRILADVEELPPFNQIASRALNMINDPTSSAADIGRVIILDQALAAKILKMANSSYYGFARKVTTIGEAIVILGYNTLKSVVFALAMKKFFNQPVEGYGLDKDGIWRHSVACALASRVVAGKVRYIDPEEAFVAGLLHDVGKLILSEYVKEDYDLILNILATSDVTFIEAEESVLGFNHQQIGKMVAEKWNLPDKIGEAIGFHHRPHEAKVEPTLTSIVHLADFICLTLGIGIGVSGMLYSLESGALKTLGISDSMIDSLVSESMEAASEINTILGSNTMPGEGQEE